MFVRVSIMVMRVCVLFALILGILFWTGVAGGPFVPLHMLLGIIIALVLLALGFMITRVKGGDINLAVGAFVLAICMTLLGLNQTTMLLGPLHWVIQVTHLLLGLLAIGIAEMIVARYKRLKAAEPKAAAAS